MIRYDNVMKYLHITVHVDTYTLLELHLHFSEENHTWKWCGSVTFDLILYVLAESFLQILLMIPPNIVVLYLSVC